MERTKCGTTVSSSDGKITFCPFPPLIPFFPAAPCRENTQPQHVKEEVTEDMKTTTADSSSYIVLNSL